MVSRNLTEVYLLMRNNAIHSRNLFSEPQQNTEVERVRLMGDEVDIETGDPRAEPAPPPWIDQLEEAHYIITRLRTKLAELQERQQRQIARPALDDSTDKLLIEKLAADVGRHFTQVHSHVAAIRAQVRHGSKTEQKVTANVVLALVTALQDLSITYRTAQSTYLKSLTSREERSNAFFDLPDFEELSLNDNTELLPGLTSNQTDLLFSLPSTSGTHRGQYDSNQIEDDTFQQQVLNQKQMLLMEEDNIRMAEEREKEVNVVVKSIIDLQDIFKDLAHMVHEQGTVLDRIDYNIEQTSVQVHEGYTQLQKAERYKRKNRKIYCICILFVSVVVLFIILVIVKS